MDSTNKGLDQQKNTCKNNIHKLIYTITHLNKILRHSNILVKMYILDRIICSVRIKYY